MRNAKLISNVIPATDQFSTAPTRPSFWSMGNTGLIPTLEAVDGFVNTTNYPGDQTRSVISDEWGAVDNVRYTLSTLSPVSFGASALGADVYNNFTVGKQYYGVVDLDGGGARIIYQPPGWGNDPLEQRSTMGYVFYNAYRILNDAWGANLTCTLV